MKKQRKHYTGEEKVAILRRHLLEKEPISKLCDEVGLQPTVFYRWQKEFFENGAAAFEQGTLTGSPLASCSAPAIRSCHAHGAMWMRDHGRREYALDHTRSCRCFVHASRGASRG